MQEGSNTCGSNGEQSSRTPEVRLALVVSEASARQLPCNFLEACPAGSSMYSSLLCGHAKCVVVQLALHQRRACESGGASAGEEEVGEGSKGAEGTRCVGWTVGPAALRQAFRQGRL